MKEEVMKKEWKILSVGNSFSVDTMELLPKIAASLGMRLTLGNLYVGGCSLNRHYQQMTQDLPAYKYYTSQDNGEWLCTPDTRIRDAVKEQNWDWISIQHGTGDGSRYTDPASYEKLIPLIDELEKHLTAPTKFAFNMTWVGESYHHHHEIRSYNGDQLLIYRLIARIMQEHILPLPRLSAVIPTGTAVQNARTVYSPDRMSRDGYHLSYGLGRYIAALTFLKALTGADVTAVSYRPEDVTPDDAEVVQAAVAHAFRNPFSLTPLQK